MGFHHSGKDRDNTADDYVCIRVTKKKMTTVAPAGRQQAPDGKSLPVLTDCDELPPDEDNLTEESDTTDPEYDAEP
jgi:hypothetical protein